MATTPDPALTRPPLDRGGPTLFEDQMDYLPDPDRQPQFYSSVPAKRLLAWFVDTAIILVLSSIVVLMTVFIGALIWPILYLTIGFVYRWVTISGNSATWGMSLAGVEIRDNRGERLDASGAFLHTLGYTVSIAFPVLQVISVALMLMTPRGQGLTDHVMGTVALNRRAQSYR